MMRPVAAIFLLALALPATATEWTTTRRVDQMTDKEIRTATVTNDAGHSFSIYRVPSGQAWANFSLSDQTLDQISPKGLLMYRIDKHEPVDLAQGAALARYGVKLHEWEPRWVNFLFWHGREEQGRGQLVALMEGTTLLIRYRLATGGYKETSFPLSGARQAIAWALQISEAPDYAKEAHNAGVEKALADARATCPRSSVRAYMACDERISRCRSAGTVDLTALLSCLSK